MIPLVHFWWVFSGSGHYWAVWTNSLSGRESIPFRLLQKLGMFLCAVCRAGSRWRWECGKDRLVLAAQRPLPAARGVAWLLSRVFRKVLQHLGPIPCAAAGHGHCVLLAGTDVSAPCHSLSFYVFFSFLLSGCQQITLVLFVSFSDTVFAIAIEIVKWNRLVFYHLWWITDGIDDFDTQTLKKVTLYLAATLCLKFFILTYYSGWFPVYVSYILWVSMVQGWSKHQTNIL